ncbi:MAG: DNA polymerase III subunit gamma/tau [Melioribacteraceae bacterium]|nr:DNA polymerase III subunit gamma/tau [Melioribacteraceae bacterium]
MNYIVSARKWRPKIFEEVVGQEHISRTIKNAIVSNRVAHAFLFAGPRGVGKTTTARILAKALNCRNNTDGEPCNNCDTCNAFNSSQSLDIIEIDGASNRRIDEIRSLREAVKYSPTTGNYKIFIIDEVHMLTNESFNALLKTLEEPPEHAIFIFATTDVHKVPLTIISRCQRFDFRRIELDAIKNQLSKIAKEDNINIDDQALTYIAKKADGALRDAQSLFDQVVSFGGKEIDAAVVSTMLNLIDESTYFQISDAILNKDFLEAFVISKTIYDNGWNYIDFLSGLIEHFRNILTVILKQDSSFVESSEGIKKLYLEYLDTFSESDLLRILTYLSKVEFQLKASQNQKLLMEISLSHLIGLESTTTITKLVKNISDGYFPSEPEKKKNEVKEEKKIEAREEVQNPSKTLEMESTSEKTAKPNSQENQPISNVDTNLSTEESSLINAIITELGGREFK